jgi:hypothetical protein
MSQRNVQIVIGQLVTDEELRRRFVRDPAGTLHQLTELGWDLSRGEVDALLEADTQLWSWMAGRLPSRLQRCSLKAQEPSGQSGQ